MNPGDNVTEVAVEEVVLCIDIDCPGSEDPTLIEPEIDGTHRYFECSECGSCYGYERVAPPSAESCAVGVPEAVRRAYSENHDSASSKVLSDRAASLLPMHNHEH